MAAVAPAQRARSEPDEPPATFALSPFLGGPSALAAATRPAGVPATETYAQQHNATDLIDLTDVRSVEDTLAR